MWEALLIAAVPALIGEVGEAWRAWRERQHVTEQRLAELERQVEELTTAKTRRRGKKVAEPTG